MTVPLYVAPPALPLGTLAHSGSLYGLTAVGVPTVWPLNDASLKVPLVVP
jgi:hypothetical protein